MGTALMLGYESELRGKSSNRISETAQVFLTQARSHQKLIAT